MASQVESIKWVPGTRFLVDGFRFQSPRCAAYFLTHAHSDHTTGLTSTFNAGPIFCSPITARILRHDFGLRLDCLRVLEPDQPAIICGVEVTPIDANHCPGAVMFLFRVPASGGRVQTVLHTGDLRWHAGMAALPALRSLVRQPQQRPAGQGLAAQQRGMAPAPARGQGAAARGAAARGAATSQDIVAEGPPAQHTAGGLDVLMLDTTYSQPKWCFPPQADAVTLMAQVMAREAAACPATLFVVGSYHIGKERAYLGAAHHLGWRVHCTPAKRQLLRLLGLPREWMDLLTDVADEAQIHVLGMGEQLHEQALTERISGSKWERVVAIRPTGWSYRANGGLDMRTQGCVTLVGVPYSEHSSWEELRDCVRTLRPRRLIPTVNAADPARSQAIVDRFADLMDLSGDPSRLDCYLLRGRQRGAVAPPLPPLLACGLGAVVAPMVACGASAAASMAYDAGPVEAAVWGKGQPLQELGARHGGTQQEWEPEEQQQQQQWEYEGQVCCSSEVAGSELQLMGGGSSSSGNCGACPTAGESACWQKRSAGQPESAAPGGSVPGRRPPSPPGPRAQAGPAGAQVGAAGAATAEAAAAAAWAAVGAPTPPPSTQLAGGSRVDLGTGDNENDDDVEDAFDLSAVDVAEQKRILAAIQQAEAKAQARAAGKANSCVGGSRRGSSSNSTTSGGNGSARKRRAGGSSTSGSGGSGGAGLVQGSLKRFYSPAPSQRSPAG